ncbi:hypothetical protein CYLTODRAFT_347276 [Cylindrobasidium torrendii FP15055 ss-10]|uniref:Alpha/beta-hydrolase n=1 Tax=Cylindrobasidium torrendii FP15055 ss-10 TaxID=1314674 RepID=A0A0D7BJQ5_9AGAR|nr:hypothetical protein CYLTODRAFT_347276 [Cylindrobasidium torrendii FP15055 ss-10]
MTRSLSFATFLLVGFQTVQAAYFTPTPRQAPDASGPQASGSAWEGYSEIPDLDGANRYMTWPLSRNATIPLYQTADLDNSTVTRAVIGVSGALRDCWQGWTDLNNALDTAAAAKSSVKPSKISVMSPCFFNTLDVDAGAVVEDQLVFNGTTWSSGHSNVLPDSISDFSAYDVLDELIAFYMDKDTFPNLEKLVIGGHSMGAQAVQRYAALRKSTKNDDRLRFWVANPGSLLWLVKDRPAEDDDCDGVDDYKYGLSAKFPAYATADFNDLGRDGIVERYFGRNVSYAWGLKDNGAGDKRCQAVTQGSTHLERGKNYVAMLEDMSNGSIPDAHTVDYVAGVSHQPSKMMNSTEGWTKVSLIISSFRIS